MSRNFKKTKLSAVCQIVLGSLCLIFGIFDRIFIYKYRWRAFHTEGVIALWTGAWFLITGVIGYFASKPYPNTQRPKMGMISTYLGFSIVATVFAGVLLICYSVGLSYITRGRSCTRYEYKCYGYYSHNCRNREVPDRECQTSVGLGAMIIVFAVVEFGVGIWASICCCMGNDGCCCDTSPQQTGQVVYLQTQGGPVAAYVMTQGPNGIPVAVPAMTGGPGYPGPNQAVGGQGYVIQNPQGAAAVTPTQYVHAAGGQVYMQNPQGTAIVTPLQQSDATLGDQQPAVKTTDASSEPPPEYTP